MFFIELEGDFDIEAIQCVVERLVFDSETGEVTGIISAPELEAVIVNVPNHIIEWAKINP